MMTESDDQRIDKWLWSARLFKTRSDAAEACKGGKIKVNDSAVKPSHDVKVGMIIAVPQGVLHKVVEVVGLPKSRVSAKDLPLVYVDRTPAEELERVEMLHAFKTEFRDRGAGRPTKKDRREIDKIKSLAE